MHRRFLQLASLLMVPFLAQAAGLSVVISGKAVVFQDVPADAWFATHVKAAAEMGIVNGYRDAQGRFTGKFGPDDPVTVEQALKIAIEGAGYNAATYPLSEGLDGARWSHQYLSVALAENFSFFGNREIIFEAPATRAEVSMLFADAFKLDQQHPQDRPFLDVQADDEFAAAIAKLHTDGIVSGDTDADGRPTERFRPGDKINRAEVVKIAIKARQTYGGTVGSAENREKRSNVRSQTEEYVVQLFEGFFSAPEITVPVGATVGFVNLSLGKMWIASNPHPVHTDLHGFDAGRAYGLEEIYEYTFTKPGTFGYHNHMNPSIGGTIIVR